MLHIAFSRLKFNLLLQTNKYFCQTSSCKFLTYATWALLPGRNVNLCKQTCLSFQKKIPLSKNSLKAGSRHVLFVQSVPFGDKKRLPEGSPNSLKHANYNSRIVFSERPVVSTIIDISTSLSRIFFATSVTAS